MTFEKSLLRTAVVIGFGLVAGTGAVAESPAYAQSAAPVQPSEVVAGLKSCRDIADEDQRLACYDTKVDAIVAASDAGEVTIVGREEVVRTRRQLFGFNVPNIGIFKSDDTDSEASELLETSITSARQLSAKSWRFTTAEGAVWEINNAPGRLVSIKAGDAVEFKKASLGFFFIRINGQLGVKGKRIQ